MKFSFTLFFIALFLMASAQESILTQQAIVHGNISIKLTASGREIKPDQLFSIQEYNMRYANNSEDNPFFVSTDCGNMISAYQDYRIRPYTYDIKVTDPRDGKSYYGKIAFFTSKSQASAEAVTHSYQISIPAEKFDNALNGRTTDVYEYYTLNGKTYPTWVIWLSDAPLFEPPLSPDFRVFNKSAAPTVDLNKKKLRSGIASTVIGGVFLIAGSVLVHEALTDPYGINGDNSDDLNSIVFVSVGSALLITSIPLLITGPIKIAKGVKGKYSRDRNRGELCLTPELNPIPHSMKVGLNLQF